MFGRKNATTKHSQPTLANRNKKLYEPPTVCRIFAGDFKCTSTSYTTWVLFDYATNLSTNIEYTCMLLACIWRNDVYTLWMRTDFGVRFYSKCYDFILIIYSSDGIISG